MNVSRRLLGLAAAALLAVVPAACGDDDDGGGEAVEESTSTSATEPEGTEVALTAALTGKEEVPGPGVTDGTGTAEVKIMGEELCYTINATMGEMPTAAHIHQGAAGAAGGVFVNLEPTWTEGESAFTAEKCVTPEAAQITAITGNPGGFYVNVHSGQFPNGAMRGQLGQSGQSGESGQSDSGESDSGESDSGESDSGTGY